MSAEYLFMQDKLYDVQYDTGDKVIQCGRHNDVFKLWLQWRAKVNVNRFCTRRPRVVSVCPLYNLGRTAHRFVSTPPRIP